MAAVVALRKVRSPHLYGERGVVTPEGTPESSVAESSGRGGKADDVMMMTAPVDELTGDLNEEIGTPNGEAAYGLEGLEEYGGEEEYGAPPEGEGLDVEELPQD